MLGIESKAKTTTKLYSHPYNALKKIKRQKIVMVITSILKNIERELYLFIKKKKPCSLS